ncbi:MAG TPA: zinc ribbon domain-containing protein, partial [Candidatus Limnocylindrales bacterium]|nr:zinc ribbon domain-containing protein [Candidatus Limnocylindrales bacterium]
AEPEPEPVAAAAAEATPPEAPTPVPADRVEQPTWRIVAPDVALPANGHPTPDVGLPAAASAAPQSPPQAAEPPEPQWPATPDWPKAQPSVPFLAGRAVATSAATEALWAASVRDIVANPAGPPAAVQPCSNCGLSLSATARFCRRCGTRQGA